ncbi:MAG: hypothetical protein ABEH81_03145 [Halopenitus sp.]
MSEQQTLTGNPTMSDREYHIFYREIKADDVELTEEPFRGKDASKIDGLVEDIFTTTGGDHTLNDLDTTRYFDRWVQQALDAAEEMDGTSPLHTQIKDIAEDLAENFSKDMKTRAKSAGKYVVIILGAGRLIICHSYTGKRALTTDMEVIEELLSADNIDKYADFTRDATDEITVSHYDKYDTKSFVEWLGIPGDEIIFDVKGDVKIYSEIGGEIETVFELSRSDVVEKLINADGYELTRDFFKTPDPDMPDYRVNHIRWGNHTYPDTEEFKQEVLTRHYELQHYEQRFEEIKVDMDATLGDRVFDKQEKVVKRTDDGEELLVKKSHSDFNTTFVHKHINLGAGWRKQLATNVLTRDERFSIAHPGDRIVNSPYEIGALRIYNDIELSEDAVSDLNDLVAAVEDLGVSNHARLLKFVVFKLLSEQASGTIQHFFGELAEECSEVYEESVNEGTRFTIQEQGPASIEMKSGEWFLKEGDEIEEGLVKKFKNGVGILLGGFDESSGKVKAIQKDRFPDERLNGLESTVGEQLNGSKFRIIPMQIQSGDLTVTAVKISE